MFILFFLEVILDPCFKIDSFYEKLMLLIHTMNTTINPEIFILKLFCKKIFEVTEGFVVLSMYNIICSIKYFVFNFRGYHGLRKYFNIKNLPIYGIKFHELQKFQLH